MTKIIRSLTNLWRKITKLLHDEHHGYLKIRPSNKKEHFPKIQYEASETDLFDDSSETLKKQTDEITRIAMETQILISEMPNEFGKALKFLRKKGKLTQKQLSEKSEVSEATIRRIENNFDYQPSKIYIAKLCIGLELNPIICQSMFDLTEHKLNNSVENIKIKIVLYDSYLKNIYDAKLLLNKMNIKTEKTEE
ncbi:helix-turn-helix domain-containing protein [Streptococcus halichoeri]|uniref:helix-turn-helix domain-containing protein n=1 Tax=Streptococcus halichoeri TaxID=254785 RepID=UPI001C8DCEF9|nr:helix-turn-helix transcriptional regulator [Streptococcus halichoeri]